MRGTHQIRNSSFGVHRTRNSSFGVHQIRNSSFGEQQMRATLTWSASNQDISEIGVVIAVQGGVSVTPLPIQLLLLGHLPNLLPAPGHQMRNSRFGAPNQEFFIRCAGQLEKKHCFCRFLAHFLASLVLCCRQHVCQADIQKKNLS